MPGESQGRGAWWAAVYGVAQSWTRLSDWTELNWTHLVFLGFACGSVGKESACIAGYLGSIPVLGRSPGEGKGYPVPYSDLYSPRGCKESIRLSEFHFHVIGEPITGCDVSWLIPVWMCFIYLFIQHFIEEILYVSTKGVTMKRNDPFLFIIRFIKSQNNWK